jgi:glutathione peroxidase
MQAEIYDIPARLIDGTQASLGRYKNKVLLIVNVASKCGLTPQYEGLEKLYERYNDEGLVVVGFPSNDFGAQEPGTNAEIVEFCRDNYAVTFPLFEKIAVKGDTQHPLYKHLTATRPQVQGNAGSTLEAKLTAAGRGRGATTDILWNFEKFVVDRNGAIVARFAPDVAPDDPMLVGAIEAAL